MKNNRVVFVFASLAAIFLMLYIPKFKSKTGKNPLDRAVGKGENKLSQKPVSVDEFILAAMPNNRPPGWVYKIITADLSQTKQDSLKKVFEWAGNAQILSIQQWVGMKLAELSGKTDSMTNAARSAIWTASEKLAESPVVSSFFFQVECRVVADPIRLLQRPTPSLPSIPPLTAVWPLSSVSLFAFALRFFSSL